MSRSPYHTGSGGPSGGGSVDSVVAGTNVTVDNTDPANPIVSSTGGGTPAGADNSVQLNQSEAFGSIADFTYDGNLNVPGQIITSGGGNLVLDGTTVTFLATSGQEIILDAGNTSAVHTIYLPDADGTLAIEQPVYSQQSPGYENTGTYVYVGYAEPGGAWYIYRRTLADNVQEYATGASDYATNWTDRAILTYS